MFRDGVHPLDEDGVLLHIIHLLESDAVRARLKVLPVSVGTRVSPPAHAHVLLLLGVHGDVALEQARRLKVLDAVRTHRQTLAASSHLHNSLK